VFLPQGFSPDGDGLNDRLVFIGLEYFSPAILKVFNRYGALVYESNDYLNDWNGNFIDTDKAVPDGTYFYVLQLKDKRKFNQYLVIQR
jgi:gliding motility-associated-like protein